MSTLSKIKLRPVTVPNPYYSRAHPEDATNPSTISAVVNVHESAITTLATRGVLDAAQIAAATKFRALFEAMGGKGADAIDYGREPVDGSTARERSLTGRWRPARNWRDVASFSALASTGWSRRSVAKDAHFIK